MNQANETTSSAEADGSQVAIPTVSREEMRQDVVTLLWAQAHVLNRVCGRTRVIAADSVVHAASAFDLLAGRSIEGFAGDEPDGPASAFGVTWADVATTNLAGVMEDLYDFAYFATFDPRYFPHALGDETSAWWVALYLKDIAASQSLAFQSEYSGQSELAAAQRLLQVVEIANARNLLEGARETFVQDSTPGFLTIRELALISGFKEESLRVLANPKRKNPLPTQSHQGTTVVAVEDARRWLQLKGRYTPITPRPASNRLLSLASARFDSPAALCEALSDHVSALASQGSDSDPTIAAVQALYPEALWQRATANEALVDAGLNLSPADLLDTPRLRALATALGFNPDLLVLKADEASLRAGLADVELRIKAQTDRP